jgi:hypothetical protein
MWAEVSWHSRTAVGGLQYLWRNDYCKFPVVSQKISPARVHEV